jgi:predicted PurR-regulated permease PerM
MSQPRHLRTFAAKSTVVVLLLALTASYALAWVHTIYEHGTPHSADQCAVCSFATSLATIGASQVVVVGVSVTGRIETPPIVVSHHATLHLPLSARSPPPAA